MELNLWLGKRVNSLVGVPGLVLLRRIHGSLHLLQGVSLGDGLVSSVRLLTGSGRLCWSSHVLSSTLCMLTVLFAVHTLD